MHKNTTAHTTSRARGSTLDNITGPLQRLLSDVHEQVFKYASYTLDLATLITNN